MEDERIIDLFFQRDEAGISEASLKYGKYLKTVAFRILGDHEDTEECVNDTWVRAWNSIPPTRPEILKAFLARITRNLALNRMEEKNAEKRGSGEGTVCLDELEEVVADRSSVEEEIEKQALIEAIEQYLGTLSSDQRNLFLQRYFHFYSIQDLARMYDWGESRVKTTLFRLRNGLKTYLRKEGFTV